MPSTFRHPQRFDMPDPPPRRPSTRRFWVGLVVLLAAFWLSAAVLPDHFWLGLGGMLGSVAAICVFLCVYAGEDE